MLEIEHWYLGQSLIIKRGLKLISTWNGTLNEVLGLVNCRRTTSRYYLGFYISLKISTAIRINSTDYGRKVL